MISRYVYFKTKKLKSYNGTYSLKLLAIAPIFRILEEQNQNDSNNCPKNNSV
jgi:hypothetical protein